MTGALNILVTGGTGKTGRRLAAQLAEAGHSPRIASRSGAAPAGQNGIVFDWLDESTHEGALAGIEAIYLVAPAGVTDLVPAMSPFIDRAIAAKVRRFVLLSATSLPENGPLMGQVHAYLKKSAPEWAVLRPTWFMQNFSEFQHALTIRAESRIYAATGDGRVPFIDASDIASAAAVALTGVALNRDVLLTGPEALSYGEVAGIIADAAQRPVTFERCSEDEIAGRFEGTGMGPDYARVLAAMDTAIANGAEDHLSDDLLHLTGRRGTLFADFAHENRRAWLLG